MSKLFFTADTHFGHDNIVRLGKRPFKNADEMDQALIARWNAVVGPNDVIYHLGDFASHEVQAPARYLEQLNGQIHLIVGNHDDRAKLEATGRFLTLSDIRELTWRGQRIALCHYPMREWPGAWRGAWHLFGHVHGRLDDTPFGYSLDVGTDGHGYAPVSVERVAEIMTTRSKGFGSG